MSGPMYRRPDMAAAEGAMVHGDDPQHEAWVAAGSKPIIPVLGRPTMSREEWDAAQQAPFELPEVPDEAAWLASFGRGGTS